jgi:aspartate aminotransferase
MAQAFEERRNFVVTRLNAIPGITSNTPHGAFYIFPKIDGLFGRRAKGQPLTTSAEVANFLLDEAGVAVVPGDAFGDDHYMRISYASSMAELEDGLGRIDRAVQQLA